MSRFDAEMSRFSGTRDGTNRPGTRGTVLRTVPPPDVPNVPPKCPDGMSRSQPVSIHGAACLLRRIGGGYEVTRASTGAQLVTAPTRFLAVARAAVALHDPRS